MGLIDRLAGEPNYDGMPDPEPPLQYTSHTQMPQWPCGCPINEYHSCGERPVLHQWVSAEPKLKVKLESHGDPKGEKCYRTWEISFEGAKPEAVLAMLEQVDDHLQARYGGLP